MCVTDGIHIVGMKGLGELVNIVYIKTVQNYIDHTISHISVLIIIVLAVYCCIQVYEISIMF